MQTHRRVASGGAMPHPIFIFAPPPDFFLAPHGIFLGGRSCCYWAEKTLKFAISARKSLRILAKTFFFFFILEITCFWSENLRFRSEKAFGFRRRPFFFFWDHLWFRPEKFGENLCPPDFNFAPPPPISRSWRRPCKLIPNIKTSNTWVGLLYLLTVFCEPVE